MAGLRINFKKSDYMAFGDTDTSMLLVDRDACKKINKLKYLGNYLNATRSKDQPQCKIQSSRRRKFPLKTSA